MQSKQKGKDNKIKPSILWFSLNGFFLFFKKYCFIRLRHTAFAVHEQASTGQGLSCSENHYQYIKSKRLKILKMNNL